MQLERDKHHPNNNYLAFRQPRFGFSAQITNRMAAAARRKEIPEVLG